MIRTRAEYLFVEGDLDDVLIDGGIMPLRTGDTGKLDRDGNPIPRTNILRGEDICFLLEALLERVSLSPLYSADESWYYTESGSSLKVWVTPAQAIFSRIIDSGIVAMLINTFRCIAGHGYSSSGGGTEFSHGVYYGPPRVPGFSWEPALGDEYAPVSGELNGYSYERPTPELQVIIRSLWPGYACYRPGYMHSSSYNKCGPVDEPGWITPTLTRVTRDGVTQIVLTRFAIEAMFENLKLMRIAYLTVGAEGYIYDYSAWNSCVTRSTTRYTWKITNPEGQEEDRGDATTSLGSQFYAAYLRSDYRATHYQGNPNWYQTGFRWAIEGYVHDIKSMSNLVLGMPRPLPTDATWRPIFILQAHWRRRERISYPTSDGSMESYDIEDTTITKFFLYVGEAKHPRSSDGRLVLSADDIRAAFAYAEGEIGAPSMANAISDAKTPSGGNAEVVGLDTFLYASRKDIDLSITVSRLFVRVEFGDHTKWW